MATKEVTVVNENGDENTVAFQTESVRIIYDDESVVNPFVVRDIERNSDRKKAEATTICGRRSVADDGDGKVEYTINCYILRETRNTIQQKKGVTGDFFNDLVQPTSVPAFIKKDTLGLASDMNSVMINGEERQMFDCQLTVIEE